jgi:acyl-CoA thioesterase
MAMARAREMHERDLTSQTLGIQLDDVTLGRATVHMRIADTMVNQHGIAHGGFIFLLADTAFAYACNSYGPVTVAQSAQVTFLQPAHVGDELHAEANERARSGRNGIYDVTVRRNGKVVAEFRGHSVQIGASAE